MSGREYGNDLSMSTEAAVGRSHTEAWAVALVALACGALSACSTSPPTTPVRHFGELQMNRPAATPDVAAPPEASAETPTLRPRTPAPVEPAPVLPVTLDGAADRVAAYLTHAGFALEQRPDGAGRLLSATRMGAPASLSGEAVCGLEAMHRPDISSTDLTVRLMAAPGGVQVETSARFVEVDTRLLAGTLTRQTCRSSGTLEAAVRRAALGG